MRSASPFLCLMPQFWSHGSKRTVCLPREHIYAKHIALHTTASGGKSQRLPTRRVCSQFYPALLPSHNSTRYSNHSYTMFQEKKSTVLHWWSEWRAGLYFSRRWKVCSGLTLGSWKPNDVYVFKEVLSSTFNWGSLPWISTQVSECSVVVNTIQ